MSATANAITPELHGHLLVVDTITGTRWTEILDHSPVRIGRPSEQGRDPEVILPSPLVSRGQHALLHWAGDGWQLEHLGQHDTLLDERPVPPGQRVAVAPGEEIRIAQFSLTLVARTRSAERGPEEAERDPEERLMLLEQKVHGELLGRLDLRRAEAVPDLASEAARRQIRDLLDELVGEAVTLLGDTDLEALLEVVLHRRFSARIMAAGGAPREEDVQDLDWAYRRTLLEVEKKIARDIGLSFRPEHMEIDSQRLDAQFNRVFQGYALELQRGPRLYLVAGLMKRDLWDLIFGLGPLQDFIDSECITEIMVVCRNQIFIEKFGVVEDSRRAFFSDEALMSVIERIVGPLNRRVDRSSPLVDARLPDGSRVNVVIPPLAVKGPCVTIRKFARKPLEVEDLVTRGALSEAMVKFLRACVESHKNIIVSGGTGTGKTTLLNCMSRFIPGKERIVSIEDTAELQLKQQHVVTLEARPPNMEGKGAVSIQDLVRNALRMRPDRIVVGECRGAEALDMLQAMNTGHDGSLTTGHANSPRDMVLRLETMVLMGQAMPVSAIREQIASALDMVVQLTRFADGSRRITGIAEVTEIDRDSGEILLEDIFVYHPPRPGEDSPGYYAHTGYIPSFIEDLLAHQLPDPTTEGFSLTTFF